MDPDLDPDAIVDRLTRDHEAADVVVLVGFLGEGPEGCVRIYCDPELRIFLDIPAGDVVHRHRIPEEQGTFGERSVIWVNGETMRAPTPRELVASAAQTFGVGAAEALIPSSLEDAAHRLTFVYRRSYPQYCP